MSFDDFMGGGRSLSFQFNAPGDSVTGQILRMEKQQQTDMNDGTPKTFANGQPRMMWQVTLQTNLARGEGLKDFDPQAEDDDGRRSVYLKWKSEQAVIDAVKASGARAPEEGGVLTLTFAKWGPKQGAFNTKLYTAVYRPPAAGAGFMPQDSPPAQPPANHPRTQAQPGGGQRPEWVEARSRGWTGGSSTLDAIQQKQQEDVPPF